MTTQTITIESLAHLEKQMAATLRHLRKIRMDAENGDITPMQACHRVKGLGIVIKARKSNRAEVVAS